MNVERQSRDTLYWMEFDFDTPSGEVRPLGSGEGANPIAAPTREQQAFAAWKEELNYEECMLENIARRDNLEHACQRVKRNKGAPGIDGITVEELERWLSTHMAEQREQRPNAITRSDSRTHSCDKRVDKLLQAGSYQQAMSETRRMDTPQIAVSASQTMQTPERHPLLPWMHRMQAQAMVRNGCNGDKVVENDMLAACKYLHG